MAYEREKVMEGLSLCISENGCDNCPYLPTVVKTRRTCKQNLMADALEMIRNGENIRSRLHDLIRKQYERIKKQEEQINAPQKAMPVAHYASPYTGLPIDHCPTCGKLIKRHQKIYTDEMKFCAYCGQEVIWNE